jgi:hypothetical protein
MKTTSRLRLDRRRFLGALSMFGVLCSVSGRLGLPVSAQDETANRYFAKTGHNLRGSFLNQWTMLGGEEAVGLPLSEEGFRDGTGIVQSFEGITLLLDPSKQPPADVAGVPLPMDFITGFASADALKKTDSCPKDAFFCQYFPQTGHSVSGRFASFWGNAGELSVLGMPVS